MKPDPVPKAELGTLVFLAAGGFGKVYSVPEFQLPDDLTALAYKEFTGDAAKRAKSRAAAEQVVHFRAALTPAERAALDEYYAWPRALVEDKPGKICGLVMPLIKPEFRWQSGNPAGKPRTMDWLAVSDGLLNANQVSLPVSENDRLYLVAQWVYAVAWLHKRGWVFGDLSFLNAAFAVAPPKVVLFDCDAAAPLTDLTRKQEHTPNWAPPKPRPGNLQDTTTDVYKLGLAIVRSLKPGSGAMQAVKVKRLAGILDADGIDLVGKALLAEHDQRPNARDLYLYLRQVAAPRMVPPAIVEAELTTPLLPRGSDARIMWRIENAEDVEIRVGQDPAPQVTSIKWRDHPNGYPLRVAESGPVAITAINPYGSMTLELGDVMLYELPAFSVTIGDLPAPVIPPVSSVSLEPISRLVPAWVSAVPDIPRIPSPEPYDLLQLFTSDRTCTSPWPRIEDAVAESSKTIVELIRTGSEGYVTALLARNPENGNA
jgi:hypothetical protein